MSQPEKEITVYLFGRYYATLSVLPYLLLAVLLFFIACFVFLMIILEDAMESFRYVMMPFMLGSVLLAPFLIFFLLIIRWHGKRRLDMDDNGITVVQPNDREVFIPWEYLVAVELRFAMPRLVQCTLVSPAIRFSFSNLEFNLSARQPINLLYEKGFEMEKMRDFLYYLHKKAPHLSWRLAESFKEQFNLRYPPYDLEKLK